MFLAYIFCLSYSIDCTITPHVYAMIIYILTQNGVGQMSLDSLKKGT